MIAQSCGFGYKRTKASRAAMKILKLRVRSSDEYESLYQQDLASGGLFVPTTSAHEIGETVVVRS